jgi:hypothetical protein
LPVAIIAVCDSVADESIISASYYKHWGTMLQAGRSPLPFQIRSLDFSVYLTLPAAL